jgi:hypothetical protein
MSDRFPTDDVLDVSRRRVLETGVLISGSALMGSAAGTAPPTAVAQAESPSVACGDSVRGELTPGDATGFRGEGHYQDEYRFEGTEGEYVSVSMATVGSDGDGFNGDPYLYLLAPDGTIVAENDDSGGNLNAYLSVTTLPVSGSYTVVATSYAPEQSFQYDLTVTCGDPFAREPIACGETVIDELTTEDATGFLSDEHAHDAYAFDGTEGEFVEISMNGVDVPTGGDGPLADPLIALLDENLDLVAWDDDSGGNLNARVNARLPQDGSYTLIATSFFPQTYFAYDLTLECRGRLNPTPLACGESVESEITPDDDSGVRNEFGQHFHDAYVFEGSADQSVTITMQADRLADSSDEFEYPLGDPYLYLFDPEGTLIAEDDDGAGDFGALIQQRLYADGEYFLVATSFGASEFFPYEVTLACSDPTVPPAEPIPVACGDRITAALEPTDSTGFLGPDYFHDLYDFEGVKGDVLTVSMSGSDGDSFLVLLDPNEEVVVFDDDSGGGFDALLAGVELGADGTYSIVATSFSPAEFFEYELTVQCR